MNQRIVYTNESGGISIVIPTGELPIEEVAAKDVPEGVAYQIVGANEIPEDRTFRAAWVTNDAAVEVDLDQAKAIGHDIRRQQRAEEFAPLDKVIAARIPGADVDALEAERQAIREKYAEVQEQIEAAATPEEIKAALSLEES